MISSFGVVSAAVDLAELDTFPWLTAATTDVQPRFIVAEDPTNRDEEGWLDTAVPGRDDIDRKSANLPKFADPGAVWLTKVVSKGVGVRVSIRLNIWILQKC